MIIFRLLQKMDVAPMKFTVYFMGYENKSDIPTEANARVEWALSRKATLELTQYDFTIAFALFLFYFS